MGKFKDWKAQRQDKRWRILKAMGSAFGFSTSKEEILANREKDWAENLYGKYWAFRGRIKRPNDYKDEGFQRTEKPWHYWYVDSVTEEIVFKDDHGNIKRIKP